MKNQIQDERIIQEAQKQNSLGFIILYFGVLLDILYRQFILQEPISKYWDLMLLFVGVSVLLAMKRIGSGLVSNKINWKSTLLSSSIAAIVYLLINYFWFHQQSPVQLIVSVIVFAATFCGVLLLGQYLSKKKNDDLSKEDES